MKRKLTWIVLIIALFTSSGCQQCYYCHNSCSVCENAHFYILIQSDILSAADYTLYLDSLSASGWSCRDTAFNMEMDICGQKGHQINNTVSTKEAAGWTCVPTDN